MKKTTLAAALFLAAALCSAETLAIGIVDADGKIVRGTTSGAASASSVLADKGSTQTYRAANAVDNDPATVWVEGASGSGIGQKLRLDFGYGQTVHSLLVRPGYFDARYWKANNRISSATIRYDGGSVRVDLEDRMADQYVVFDVPVSTSFVELQIDGVYNGDRWDDTCLSDLVPIEIDKGGRAAPLVPADAAVVVASAAGSGDSASPEWLAKLRSGSYGFYLDTAGFAAASILLRVPSDGSAAGPFGEVTGTAFIDEFDHGFGGSWIYRPADGHTTVEIGTDSGKRRFLYAPNPQGQPAKYDNYAAVHLLVAQEIAPAAGLVALIEAVKAGDAAGARNLVSGVENLDAAEPPYQPPLWYALSANNAEITRLLLSKGATIDYQWVRELYGAMQATVKDALRATGHGDLLGAAASGAMYVAIVRGEIAEAGRLIRQEGASLDDSLTTALLYASGSDELLRLFHASAPKSIVSGATNLVAMIEGDGISLTSPGLLDTNLQKYLKFPLATSFLWDDKAPSRYTAARAFDGDPATSWVEGAEGPGIGQKISFFVPTGEHTIAVLPGYGDAKFFSRNNRVKAATISFRPWVEEYGANTQSSTGRFRTSAAVSTVTLRFADAMKLQETRISVPASAGNNGLALAVLEIREVYRGSDWDDTCIAEIQIDGKPGTPAWPRPQ